jgi:hypothetical protein
MSTKKNSKLPHDGLKIKGMFRVQINDDGRIVGDSGWKKNQITNLGFNNFLVSSLGAIAGSSQISYVALGTGTVPGAAATSLPNELGETNGRAAVTAATSSSSKTVRFTGTFASANSFATASRNIANIGLFATSTQNAGTLFAGNTFSSSTVATNQNVNVTYDIIFS